MLVYFFRYTTDLYPSCLYVQKCFPMLWPISLVNSIKRNIILFGISFWFTPVLDNLSWVFWIENVMVTFLYLKNSLLPGETLKWQSLARTAKIIYFLAYPNHTKIRISFVKLCTLTFALESGISSHNQRIVRIFSKMWPGHMFQTLN